MANMASACALMSSGGDVKMLFGPVSRWRARAAANTCMLVTISAICACVLVVCGVLLVREYTLARAYHETSCSVQNVTYTGAEQICTYCSGSKDRSNSKAATAASTITRGDAGAGTSGDRESHGSVGGRTVYAGAGGTTAACSQSQFPCLQVIVIYTAVSGIHYQALLHPDSLQAAGQNSQCSYEVCLKDRHDNWSAVERYASRWRAALRAALVFPCHYNTIEFSDAIVTKVYTESDVVHSMFWPSLVIVACCAVFLRLETRRRRLTFCGRRPDPSTSPAGASLLLLPIQSPAGENLDPSVPGRSDAELGSNHPPPAPPPTPSPAEPRTAAVSNLEPDPAVEHVSDREPEQSGEIPAELRRYTPRRQASLPLTPVTGEQRFTLGLFHHQASGKDPRTTVFKDRETLPDGVESGNDVIAKQSERPQRMWSSWTVRDFERSMKMEDRGVNKVDVVDRKDLLDGQRLLETPTMFCNRGSLSDTNPN